MGAREQDHPKVKAFKATAVYKSLPKEARAAEVELIARIIALQESDMLRKTSAEVQGIGRLPSLRTQNYADFHVRFCLKQWNPNKMGISIREITLCNPTIDDDHEFIYFLLKNDSEKVLYVGRSSKLFDRIDTHARDKEFDFFSWILVEKKYVSFLEGYYIGSLNPALNKTGHIRHSVPKIRRNSWMLMGGKLF